MSILIAKEAPDFTAPAVMPGGSIEDHFKLSSLRGKYVVLFSAPLKLSPMTVASPSSRSAIRKSWAFP